MQRFLACFMMIVGIVLIASQPRVLLADGEGGEVPELAPSTLPPTGSKTSYSFTDCEATGNCKATNTCITVQSKCGWCEFDYVVQRCASLDWDPCYEYDNGSNSDCGYRMVGICLPGEELNKCDLALASGRCRRFTCVG